MGRRLCAVLLRPLVGVRGAALVRRSFFVETLDLGDLIEARFRDLFLRHPCKSIGATFALKTHKVNHVPATAASPRNSFEHALGFSGSFPCGSALEAAAE